MGRQLNWYSFRWQIGLVTVALAFACWYFLAGRFIHPVGRGPAGPPVSPEPFARVWSTEKVVLLGLGDSITAGYGASPGRAYFDLVVKNDDTAYPCMAGRDLRRVLPNLDARNYAVSYTCSEEHLEQQVPGIEVFPADVRGIVVISTGGNDVIHDYGRSAPRDGAMYGCTVGQALRWRKALQGRLRGIIGEINARFPGGCEIFMANIYDPTDGVGDIEHAHLLLPRWPDGLKVLALVNEVIAETCAAHPNVHLVDIHSAFLGHGIHCREKLHPYYRKNDPHYWYFKNLEDPNDRGYDAIRRVFLVEIARTMAPRQ